jgi:hypothetical protein
VVVEEWRERGRRVERRSEGWVFWLGGCRKVFLFLSRRLRHISLTYDRMRLPVGGVRA